MASEIPEIPEVDVSSGLEICDGNMAIYLNSLRLFATSIPKSLQEMKGVSAETLEDYAVTVHSVKSMSHYIGAEEARKTAKELEAMAKDGNLAGVQAKNDAFVLYAQSVVGNVQSWLDKNDR